MSHGKFSKVDHIRDVLGFDESYVVPFKGVRVRCSQCQVLGVNGVPTHETGCPNDTHECRGCSNRVPANRRYCEDCS